MSKQPYDARNMEYLTKEAKELKKRHQLHDPEAVAVIQAACPDLASPNQSADSKLRHYDYQAAVARQYGFSDWHKMVSYASGKPRRENGRIVISEDKHETLADALNDRASLHGMPVIGTKLNNEYGIEWTIADYDFFPTPTTFARYPKDCDFLPIVAPQNISQRLIDFIIETDRCTSKRIYFLDTMPDLHPFKLGRDIHCTNYSGNPEESYIFFDFARVHETTFAHEVAHLWFIYIENGDGCRVLNDQSDNGKLNQLDFIQSFVLDLRVNDLIADRGFDMELLNHDQIRSMTIIRDWLIKGYKPHSAREVLVNSLSIAAAFLEQKRWSQEMRDQLTLLLGAIETMNHALYNTAMRFVDIINTHGYKNKASARASIDGCIEFGFSVTGDNLDVDRDLREPRLNECMQDKHPELFPNLPVELKLEIGKALARAGIGSFHQLSLSACQSGAAQIMVEVVPGKVVGQLAVNYQLIPYHIIDERERRERQKHLPDRYGRLPVDPAYGVDLPNPYGRTIMPGMIPDAYGRIAGDPGYNTAYPPGKTPQEIMAAMSNQSQKPGHHNPNGFDPMLPNFPNNDFRRQYMAGVGLAVAREQATRSMQMSNANLYEFAYNNPVKYVDPSGNAPILANHANAPLAQSRASALGLAAPCLSAPPAPSSSPLCDKYGCTKYPVTGTNLRCFCKCAGDSPWSDEVRGCLACMFAKGVNITTAHFECYEAANKHHKMPAETIAICLAECGPPPPLLPITGPIMPPIPFPSGGEY